MKIGFIAFVFILLLSHLARADEFTFIDGTYDMQIKIGDTTFNDQVEFVTRERGFLEAELSGFVTVPNAFRAELTGRVQYGAWVGIYFVNFTIVARENGQEFKVNYKGQINTADYNRMEGTATLEDGKLLGNFIAVKRQ